jgi:hypothetical protein
MYVYIHRCNAQKWTVNCAHKSLKFLTSPIHSSTWTSLFRRNPDPRTTRPETAAPWPEAHSAPVIPSKDSAPSCASAGGEGAATCARSTRMKVDCVSSNRCANAINSIKCMSTYVIQHSVRSFNKDKKKTCHTKTLLLKWKSREIFFVARKKIDLRPACV